MPLPLPTSAPLASRQQPPNPSQDTHARGTVVTGRLANDLYLVGEARNSATTLKVLGGEVARSPATTSATVVGENVAAAAAADVEIERLQAALFRLSLARFIDRHSDSLIDNIRGEALSAAATVVGKGL